MGIPEQEIEVSGFPVHVIEVSQVTNKNALELGAIESASEGLARLKQDAAAIDHYGESGVSDSFGLGQVAGVASHFVHVGQAAEDDTLVIGPGGFAVVLA